MLGLVEPGTLVVLIEPFYNSYRAEAILAGAKWTGVPLAAGDDGWRLDVAALRDAVRDDTDDTTMIIINAPHNPTGTIFTRSELEAIADVALDSGAFVLADEGYERLLYDGHPHLSIADLDGMRDRCVIVSSAAKTFNVTGWKKGPSGFRVR